MRNVKQLFVKTTKKIWVNRMHCRKMSAVFRVVLILPSSVETPRQDKKFIKIWQPKAGLVQYIVQ